MFQVWLWFNANWQKNKLYSHDDAEANTPAAAANARDAAANAPDAAAIKPAAAANAPAAAANTPTAHWCYVSSLVMI